VASVRHRRCAEESKPHHCRADRSDQSKSHADEPFQERPILLSRTGERPASGTSRVAHAAQNAGSPQRRTHAL
jgi:hypothetical protein